MEGTAVTTFAQAGTKVSELHRSHLAPVVAVMTIALIFALLDLFA